MPTVSEATRAKRLSRREQRKAALEELDALKRKASAAKTPAARQRAWAAVEAKAKEADALKQRRRRRPTGGPTGTFLDYFLTL